MCMVNCAKTMELLPQAVTVSQLGCDLQCEEERCREGNFKSTVELILPSRRDSGPITPDAIAVATQWSKRAVQGVARKADRMKNTKLMRVLTKTSQPAHIVAVIVTCVAMYLMYPEATPTSTNTTPISCADESPIDAAMTSPQNLQGDHNQQRSPNKIALFGYLSSFAIQFGAQIWMTFVSGLALYFSLPRHTFGQCQRVLFPKYFLMNAGLGLVKLYCFCKMLEGNEKIGTAAFVQIVLIGMATLIEAGIYLHLVEPLLNLMCLKHKYELMVGSGQEVGFENLKALKESPAYKAVHRGFRKMHSLIAMGNLMTVACSFSHIYFMCQRIQMA